MTTEDAIAENREGWDKVAKLHAQGTGAEFYRIEQWLAGECKLGPWELEEVGPVVGKSLLHLQCHIGTDTLSWARHGAKVTGLDFSSAAITEANRFAKILDIPDAQFVTGKVQDAPELLGGETFDILYTGRGALIWLPDLEEWGRICSQLVKPGGILYLEESHPTMNLLDVVETEKGKLLVPSYDPFRVDHGSETMEGSYADPNAPTGPITSHYWEYRFESIINGLVSNGFQIDFLNERQEIFFTPWDADMFESSRPNYWKLKEEYPTIPMSFTLRATRK